MPGDGHTWTIMADQAPGHPGSSFPLQSLEGCGTDSLGNYSMGFVTQFPLDDQNHFIDIDCEENIGSYDPNDKQVSPVGVGKLGNISRGQPLQYKVRFQNTGTDTAFNVIILDTLSPHLDISTLQIGAASHHFEVHVIDDRVVEWAFPNILLPDSNVNEPASHGFLHFTIQQEDSLPYGTMITNRAGIYFDFNEPIITNTTLNTVVEDYKDSLVNNNPTVSIENSYNGIDRVFVYPNPASESVTFTIDNPGIGHWEVELTDLIGRRVGFYHGYGTQLTIIGLPDEKGIYFYRVVQDNKALADGKLIIH